MDDGIILGILKTRTDEKNQAKYFHTIAQENSKFHFSASI